jgi:LCP family protein required for cell wall assembly
MLQGSQPPGSRRRRRRTRSGLPRALGLTALSALVPGIGHLAARRRVAGWLLLTSFVLLLATAAVLAFGVPRSQLLEYAVDPQILRYLMGAAAVLGAAWVLVVVSSYVVTRPRELTGRQRFAGGVVVGVLVLAVAAPFAFAARTAYVQHDLIGHVFGDNVAPARPSAGIQAAPEEDQRVIRKVRVNVLLLGSDAAENRDGVRTDSMILASIDTTTGNTVLISLPRNLQRVRFPPDTPMAERFPRGFPDLLNAVYRYAEENKAVAQGARFPGAHVLKQAFGQTVGLEVDYFVLVNLAGFRDIVDALGGVRINVERRIPVGGWANDYGRIVVPPNRYIEKGEQTLNGEDALWYGRSRIGSDDYERMQRQRCLLGALARQADPLRVLTRFRQLASATKRIVLTDIPQEALPELVSLAAQAKQARITSVTFVRSARFLPHDPDFDYVRAKVRAALRESVAPPPSASPADTSVARTQAGSTPSARSSPRASATPKPADAGLPVSLDDVCSYA